jgi:DNA-directed RNA polymerase subunit beta
MLTIKSDDVVGRTNAYDAIIKGTSIHNPHIPSSFNVLVSELKSLGFSINPVNEKKTEKKIVKKVKNKEIKTKKKISSKAEKRKTKKQSKEKQKKVKSKKI